MKKQTNHRYAKLWKITRVDDEEYYFTSHDKNITYSGDVYTPVYGLTGSAYEEGGNLESGDRQFDGVFNSLYIVKEDMVLGKFNNASVVEYMLDWRYPWSGVFYTAPFWILRLSFSNSRWSADIVSTLDKLKDEVGELYTSDCRHKFCDDGCGLLESSFDYTATLTSYDISSERRLKCKVENADFSGSPDDGDFEHGYLEGSTSQNTGFKREIKSHSFDSDNSPYYHTIELYFPMPEEMTSLGGTYTFHEGCDKDITTCENRFGNRENHGGWFLCPGNDMVTNMPDAVD